MRGLIAAALYGVGVTLIAVGLVQIAEVYIECGWWCWPI